MISSAEEAALLVSWMIVTAKDMSINATGQTFYIL